MRRGRGVSYQWQQPGDLSHSWTGDVMQARRPGGQERRETSDLALIIVDVVQTGVESRERAGRREEHLCRD